MSSINAQIDAAVVRDKERAAKFDNAAFLPMDEWVKRDGKAFCMRNLMRRAETNLAQARRCISDGTDPTPHLCDARNLEALILSLLEVAP